MLHTNFLGNRPANSGDDFESFLPYMGMVAILAMRPDHIDIFSFLCT